MKRFMFGLLVLAIVSVGFSASAEVIGDPDVTMNGKLSVSGDVIVGFDGQSFIQVRPSMGHEYTLRVFKSGGNRDVLSLVKGSAGNADYIEAMQGNTQEIVFKVKDGGAGYFKGNVSIGRTTASTALDVEGDATIRGNIISEVVEIRGTGALDLAEAFKVNDQDVQPGMVASIDPEKVGELRLSNEAYDRKVVGIVSGAGSLRPGIRLGGKALESEGQYPIALSGRVWCWVDASSGAVVPGDMLTTSSTLGHAAKVTDLQRAQGAVIGKAMSSLNQGKGLVLVLVNLH